MRRGVNPAGIEAGYDVLLVEDDDDHAELVSAALEGQKIPNHVTRVTNGEEAIAYLNRMVRDEGDRLRPRPHVVLLDLRLPKMDGIEVLKHIRGQACLDDLVVVILTTSAAERDIAVAYAHHANSYLVKPVEYDDFCRLMDTLSVYWMKWNRTSTSHP